MRRLSYLALALLTLVWAGASARAESCARVDALDAFAQTGEALGEAQCTVFMGLSGENGVSCHWAYGFRDPAAGRFAVEVWDDVIACRAGVAMVADLAVNHPDSYALKILDGPRKSYAVSVKDKGAARETHVFLRVENRP